LRAAEPGLALPAAADLLGADQLVALAKQHAAAGKARRRSGLASIRDYVTTIDALLRNSAETRGSLGRLVSEVQSYSIDPGTARDRISSIIAQRQDLHNQIASLAAPPPFRQAAELLRRSISASLEDDYAIQGWINAWYAGDAYTSDRYFREHESATSKASAAKATFLREYNRLRRRYLHLPPINIAY
jgi:hypothetical protein